MSDENEGFKPITTETDEEFSDALDEALEEDVLGNEAEKQEEKDPVLTGLKGEYLHIYHSKDEEFYIVRCLRDFEVLDKGPSAWDLVSSLETDGFVEILNDPEVMDGIDFAWAD